MPDTNYTIEFAPRTEGQLNLIPKDIRNLIFERIDKLKTNPRPENIEPLQGVDKGLFRIRRCAKLFYLRICPVTFCG